MFISARKGYGESVESILKHKDLDVNQVRSVHGTTALHEAAENGHVKVVQYLVNHQDINVNMADRLFGQTPLYVAALNGHGKVVEVLSKNKDFDVNFMDEKTGTTTLYLAAKNGHLRCAERLLDASPPLMVCKVNSSKAKCSTSVYSNKPEDGGGRLRVVAKPIGR